MPIMDYLTPNTASRTPTTSTSSIDSLSVSSDTKAHKQSRSKSFGGVFKKHRLSWGSPSVEKFRLGERDSSNEDCSGGIGGKPYNEQQLLGDLSSHSYANRMRRSSDSNQLIRNPRKGNESEEFKATETYRLPGPGFVGTNVSKNAVSFWLKCTWIKEAHLCLIDRAAFKAVDPLRRIIQESTQSWVVPCLVRQTSAFTVFCAAHGWFYSSMKTSLRLHKTPHINILPLRIHILSFLPINQAPLHHIPLSTCPPHPETP